MDFFEQQDQARQKTLKLLLLLGIAVVIIIILTTMIISIGIWGAQAWNNAGKADALLGHFNWPLLLKTAVVVIAVIAGIVLYKHFQMAHGGYTIADRLGAKPVYPDTDDADERQLLNVVEEMALAAGLPVPPVYVLDETTINAFAAGYSDNDAVIGITRGALQRLTRDQLQGVIAHEFSHILHGDMRLNLNLITLLSGIIFIGQAGRSLVGTFGRIRGSKNLKGGAFIATGLGVSLTLIGAIGTFFAKLIRAAVCRQREFLADACAVQYTRNPDGIAGALKVIGSGVGTGVRSHLAEEFSHLFFGDVIYFRSLAAFATHPPLEERIRRIDRFWDGSYLPGKPLKAKPALTTEHRPGLDHLPDSLKSIGMLDAAMMTVALNLIEAMPSALHEATQHPASAHALMLALRLDSNPAIQQQQLAYLSDQPDKIREIRRLKPLTDKLHPAEVLPLIEIAVPALKRQSAQQYEQLMWLMMQFIMADKVSDYREWLHYRLLGHYLDPQFSRPSTNRRQRRNYHGLYQVDRACSAILSLLANVSHDDEEGRDRAFNHGLATLNIKVTRRLDQDTLDLRLVNQSLMALERLVPLLKQQFLAACANCIAYNSEITVMAWDLLRLVSACLGCPMPLVTRPTARDAK